MKNPNGDDGLQSWRAFGNASVVDCSTGKCFSIHEDGFILQDVSVDESAVGMFAILIGFASIEDVKALLEPRASKLAGAIAGRALYDGRLDPTAALTLIRNARAAA